MSVRYKAGMWAASCTSARITRGLTASTLALLRSLSLVVERLHSRWKWLQWRVSKVPPPSLYSKCPHPPPPLPPTWKQDWECRKLTLHSKTLNITFIVFGEVCIWKILKIVTRLSLPLYKKNISLDWEIIIIVLVFQFKLQEYLPIALVAFTTIPSTVVKSDILSTKDGFVILKLKAKKAKLLNSTMNKFEPNWSITQVPSARKQVRHFWFNFWLPGVVTWRYFSNLPKKQI